MVQLLVKLAILFGAVFGVAYGVSRAIKSSKERARFEARKEGRARIQALGTSRDDGEISDAEFEELSHQVKQSYRDKGIEIDET